MIFCSLQKKYLEVICKLWSSCLGLNVLKASFPHARYYHDYSNPLHIRKQHVFPAYLLTWLLKITLQHANMISYEMITKCCNQLLRYWSSIWYVIALKTESRHDANIVITQGVIMMTTCTGHSDDKVGITTIFDIRYYSWSSEHQDYGCNTLPLATISGKWISYVLPCFKYASSGDRQCITLGESLWTMNQFLVTNESQVYELCVSMFRNKWYWFIQIHLDKPYCAAIEPESTQWSKLDAAPFWHIMAYLRGCNIL